MNFMTFAAAETDFVETAEKELGKFEELLDNIWSGFCGKLPVIIAAIIVLVVGVFISRLTVRLMSKAMDKSRLDLTINRFVHSAVKIVLYVLVITVVLTILGVPMTSIITVIGTAGVAVGLALQDSLSNLAGGFLILFSKPFRVGNYIQCSGVEGTVESISILYTKLLTGDNKAVFIPNGTAAGAVVTNYSEMPERRVDLVFGISYEADYDEAKRAIEETVAKDERVLREPFIVLSSLDASSVAITVRLWTKTENYWSVYYRTLEEVRRAFSERGIEIPYNKLDVHICK